MNNKVSAILVVFVTCLLGMSASVDMSGSDGNKIAKLFKYVAMGSFLIGLLQPKLAFYWLFLVAAYLNLFKRMSIFDAGINFMDLIALNLPPAACVAGICISTIFGFIRGEFGIRKAHVLATLCAAAVGGAAVGAKMLGGAGAVGGGLSGAVDAGVFIFLIPMAAIHFRSGDDMARLLRWVCLIFFPVAAYAVYQAFYGISWWESTFEFGGFLGGQQRELGDVRAFSTLNSAISLSSVMAMCMAFSVFLARSKSRGGIGISWLTAAIYLVVFAAGLGATMRRSGILLFVAAIFAVIAFRRSGSTLLIYGMGSAALLSFYIFSAPLLKWTWDNRSIAFFSDSDYINRMVQFSTWQDRLAGFKNMTTNPNLWEPFGVSKEYIQRTTSDKNDYYQNIGTATDFSGLRGVSYTHDALSNGIVSYGYVPMGLVLIFGISCLSRLHGRLLSLPLRSRERFGLLWLVGLSAGIAASGITSNQALTIAPVNIFAYTIFGFTLQLWLNAGRRSSSRGDSRAGGAEATQVSAEPRLPGSGVAT